MEVKDFLKHRRIDLGLTLKDVANACGVSEGTVSRWESGDIVNMRRSRIMLLAEVLQVSPLTIMGSEEAGVTGSQRYNLRPRLGAIACGEPILAEQNIEDYDAVPTWVDCTFTLVCKGDSMTNARIYDGDIVCIKQQPTVENGQIAAVMVDDGIDCAATLKRVRFLQGGGIALLPENSAYEPLVFTGEDVARVTILGLATHFIAKVE